VVGATVGNVVMMLTKDFLQLIIVAILIAFPLAWWATEKWLDGFAYRARIGAGVYMISAILILVITMITIGYQALKSAFVNPVKSLRSE